jgi:translation initiation factor IF-3
MTLPEALTLARSQGVDLVEIAPTATPPVCRLVEYGKYRYEQAKKHKDSKRHNHASKVKEVQLSPKIDPHDLKTKVEHAVEFLCEDMKVKITLKFRGREMAHTEYGFQVIQKFLSEVAAYGHPDFEPKLIGRGINLMISPLPRNKRAKNPRGESAAAPAPEANSHPAPAPAPTPAPPAQKHVPQPETAKAGAFVNNPFAQLEINR